MKARAKLAIYVTKEESKENCKSEDEEGIKELSLFEKQDKKRTMTLQSSRKGGLTIENEIEEAISDAEAEKNSNVVYKEKEQSINNHAFRHLIFSPNVTESTFRRFLILTHRGLVYAKKCLKQPSEKFIRSKQIVLKESKSKKKRSL